MAQAGFIDRLDFGAPGEYRRLDIEAPSKTSAGLLVPARGSLEALAETAFSEIAFRMPESQARAFAAIAADENAQEAERFVAVSLLRNAAIAAEGLLPICQDTGTAVVYGWKGGGFLSAEGEDDEAAIAMGTAHAWSKHRLRFSQLAPLDMLSERNTRDNLPAAIDIRSVPGDSYRFLFAAKGGGSTSRTSLSMESPASLNQESFGRLLRTRIEALGTSGCPPYTIAAVLGGATPSQTLYALELAVFGLLDRLPRSAEADGCPLRDEAWEAEMLCAAAGSGLGAQWGGAHMASEARAIRLSRHAANLPFAVGIACSAHRHERAFADASGWYLERMEADPARFLPAKLPILRNGTDIDFDAPEETWLAALRTLKAGDTVTLSGEVAVARDAAHARILALLREGRNPPAGFAGRPVFYAGPTEAAPGAVSGSFGPTTASRMDSYLEPFMARGLSLVTVAKGGRGAQAAKVIGAHHGVYLAAIGGAAALAAREQVSESRVAAFPELGMEALRIVRLRRMPAIVAVDSGGIDLYARD
ncbi:MAG: fumarate hydratase [Rectinemataceae bacterium]